MPTMAARRSRTRTATLLSSRRGHIDLAQCDSSSLRRDRAANHVMGAAGDRMPSMRPSTRDARALPPIAALKPVQIQNIHHPRLSCSRIGPQQVRQGGTTACMVDAPQPATARHTYAHLSPHPTDQHPEPRSNNHSYAQKGQKSCFDHRRCVAQTALTWSGKPAFSLASM